MVQEHQKIKSFSLRELTKQRQNKRNTKCKGRTILNHDQIRPRKKFNIFHCQNPKIKAFWKKNHSFRRSNEHAVKKQKTEIKKTHTNVKIGKMKTQKETGRENEPKKKKLNHGQIRRRIL